MKLEKNSDNDFPLFIPILVRRLKRDILGYHKVRIIMERVFVNIFTFSKEVFYFVEKKVTISQICNKVAKKCRSHSPAYYQVTNHKVQLVQYIHVWIVIYLRTVNLNYFRIRAYVNSTLGYRQLLNMAERTVCHIFTNVTVAGSTDNWFWKVSRKKIYCPPHWLIHLL